VEIRKSPLTQYPSDTQLTRHITRGDELIRRAKFQRNRTLFAPQSSLDSTNPNIVGMQGSGTGGMRRKTEVSIGITQSIQMDRIPSANGIDQESYDERKIATVA